MEFSILMRITIGKGVMLWAIISFGFLPHIHAQTRENHTDTTLNNFRYISAFAKSPVTQNREYPLAQDGTNLSGKSYTIQICTLTRPVEDSFFKGNYVIRYVRMGDLYRYIFSASYTLQEARQKLLYVQKLFPGACIREYRQGILGQVVDMNIDL